MIKSKYLAVHHNKCGRDESLGIDYHWCGNGQGGSPNLELMFDTTTGALVGAVFMETTGGRWHRAPTCVEGGVVDVQETIGEK